MSGRMPCAARPSSVSKLAPGGVAGAGWGSSAVLSRSSFSRLPMPASFDEDLLRCGGADAVVGIGPALGDAAAAEADAGDVGVRVAAAERSRPRLASADARFARL